MLPASMWTRSYTGVKGALGTLVPGHVIQMKTKWGHLRSLLSVEGSPDGVRDPKGLRMLHCGLPMCLSPYLFLVMIGLIFFHNSQVRLCRVCTVQGAQCETKSRLPPLPQLCALLGVSLIQRKGLLYLTCTKVKHVLQACP